MADVAYDERYLQRRLETLAVVDRLVLLAKLANELAATAIAAAHPNRGSDLPALQQATARLRVFMAAQQRISQAMLDSRFGGILDPEFIRGLYTAAQAVGCGPDIRQDLESVLYFSTRRERCPCCGFYTLAFRGRYEICPVCFWEDEDPAVQFGEPAPWYVRGANHVDIEEARKNFVAFGASEERFKQSVRPPSDEELPEHNHW